MKYLLIARDNISKAWPFVSPWILQAVEGTNLEEQLGKVEANLLAGGAQLWVGGLFPDIQMVLVTEGMMVDGVPTLVLRIFVGEELEKHIEHLSVVQHWAVENGYRAMQVCGRLGWKRKLRSLGYEPSYLVLTKQLKKELH